MEADLAGDHEATPAGFTGDGRSAPIANGEDLLELAIGGVQHGRPRGRIIDRGDGRIHFVEVTLPHHGPSVGAGAAGVGSGRGAAGLRSGTEAALLPVDLGHARDEGLIHEQPLVAAVGSNDPDLQGPGEGDPLTIR